jgi:hypothetical protein
MAFRGLRDPTSENSDPEVFSRPVVRVVSTPLWNAMTWTPALDSGETEGSYEYEVRGGRFAENNRFTRKIQFL